MLPQRYLRTLSLRNSEVCSVTQPLQPFTQLLDKKQPESLSDKVILWTFDVPVTFGASFNMGRWAFYK